VNDGGLPRPAHNKSNYCLRGVDQLSYYCGWCEADAADIVTAIPAVSKATIQIEVVAWDLERFRTALEVGPL